MNDELKACPFCGKKQLDATDDCVCQGEELLLMSRGAWNKRPIEDALAARITALEAEVSEITEVARRDGLAAIGHYQRTKELEAELNQAVYEGDKARDERNKAESLLGETENELVGCRELSLKFQAKYKQLKEATRWISVDERLPKEGGSYPTLCGWSTIPQMQYFHVDKKKFITSDWVRCWFELPEPPEGGAQ